METVAAADLETKLQQLLEAVDRERAPLELTAYVVRGEPITFGDAASEAAHKFDDRRSEKISGGLGESAREG